MDLNFNETRFAVGLGQGWLKTSDQSIFQREQLITLSPGFLILFWEMTDAAFSRNISITDMNS